MHEEGLPAALDPPLHCGVQPSSSLLLLDLQLRCLISLRGTTDIAERQHGAHRLHPQAAPHRPQGRGSAPCLCAGWIW